MSTIAPAPRGIADPSRAELPAHPPRVSIVIPAHDEEAVIERCLRASVDQTQPAHEIIVVDNRSTDRTAALARAVADAHPGAGIRILAQHDEPGLVPTRNRGLDAARGDVIGRIDADSVIDRDWVRRVSARMTDPSVGAVSGPVTYYDLPFAGAGRLSDDVARRALRRLGHECPFLFGSNMAIRAKAWRRIRDDVCRDREDRFHEDIDLSVHLHDAGIAVAYDPSLRAAISARRLSTRPDDFRDYARRFERTYRAHHLDQWYLRTPQHLLRSVYWWTRVLRVVAPSDRRAVAA